MWRPIKLGLALEPLDAWRSIWGKVSYLVPWVVFRWINSSLPLVWPWDGRFFALPTASWKHQQEDDNWGVPGEQRVREEEIRKGEVTRRVENSRGEEERGREETGREESHPTRERTKKEIVIARIVGRYLRNEIYDKGGKWYCWWLCFSSVSYTHLTLPTIYSV